MNFILVTRDPAVVEATNGAFQQEDTLQVFEEWGPALDACESADMLFVDLVATLEQPHRIAGYEKFAHAKMAHEHASTVPLVIISPPANYEMDFFVGWPNFVFAHLSRPVTYKLFRRATTWI